MASRPNRIFAAFHRVGFQPELLVRDRFAGLMGMNRDPFRDISAPHA
jgi:hypothetical protein